MSYIETVAAVIIFSLFMALLCQISFPLLQAVSVSRQELEAAKSIEFVHESFKRACATKARNVEKWKNDITVVNGLKSCEVTEIVRDSKVCAMKAVCVIGMDRIEMLAECGNE